MRVASPRHDHGFFEVAHILNVPFDDSVSLVMREAGRKPESPSPELLGNGRVHWKEIEPSFLLEPGAGEPVPRPLILVLGRGQRRNVQDPHDLLALGGVEDVARELEHTLHPHLGWGGKVPTPRSDFIPVGRP
jgi:hypothetical protein